jgi:outer membrane biosynthesis protein TonB
LAGLVVAIAVAWGGCTTIKSIVSRPPAPKVTIPPPPPVKKEPEAPQPAKKEPEAPPTTKEPLPTKAPAPPPPVKKEPEAPQPAKKEPEAPPTKKEPETAPPVLAPQVGKGDEEQSKRTAGSRIQRTEELIRLLEGKKLTHDQREQLLTVQNLLGSAKEALAAQDLAKASNLAEKARILAEELTQAVK